MPVYQIRCTDADHDSRAGQPGHSHDLGTVEFPAGTPIAHIKRSMGDYLCQACARVTSEVGVAPKFAPPDPVELRDIAEIARITKLDLVSATVNVKDWSSLDTVAWIDPKDDSVKVIPRAAMDAKAEAAKAAAAVEVG